MKGEEGRQRKEKKEDNKGEDGRQRKEKKEDNERRRRKTMKGEERRQ